MGNLNRSKKKYILGISLVGVTLLAIITGICIHVATKESAESDSNENIEEDSMTGGKIKKRNIDETGTNQEWKTYRKVTYKEEALYEEEEEDEDDLCLTDGCLGTAALLMEFIKEDYDPCKDFYRFACTGWMIWNPPKKKTGYKSIKDQQARSQYLLIYEMLKKRSNDSAPKFIKKLENAYYACEHKRNNDTVGREFLWDTVEPLLNAAEREFRRKTKLTNLLIKMHESGLRRNMPCSFNVATDKKDISKLYFEMNFTKEDVHYGKYDYYKSFRGRARQILDECGLQGFSEENIQSTFKTILFTQDRIIPVTNGKSNTYYGNVEYESGINSDSRQTITEVLKSLLHLENIDEKNTFMKFNFKMTNLSDLAKFMGYLFIEEDGIDQNVLHYRANRHSIEISSSRLDEPYFVQDSQKIEPVPFIVYKVGENALNVMNETTDCIYYLIKYMDVALTAAYVKRFGNADSSKMAIDIISYVQKKLLYNLRNMRWMNHGDRLSSVSKVEGTIINFPHSPEIVNDVLVEKFYENLNITSESHFINYMNLEKFHLQREFEYYQRRYKNLWMDRARIDPNILHYRANRHSIDISSSRLDEPFFVENRPNSMNFGGIGSIISQLLMRGIFPPKGNKHDVKGNYRDWWVTDTKKSFAIKTDCFEKQYRSQAIPGSTEANLKKEDFGVVYGDTVGFKMAYEAYLTWKTENSPEPKLPGLNYTSNQLFWISLANVKCANYDPDTRSFFNEPFRINAALANLEEFSRDFGCPKGSPMNLKNKCDLWKEIQN